MHAQQNVWFFVAAFIFNAATVNCQNRSGTPCTTPTGSRGNCTPIRNCTVAIQDLRFFQTPTQCGYEGKTLLICCLPDIRRLQLEPYNCGFKLTNPALAAVAELTDEDTVGVCTYTQNCTAKATVDKYKLQASICGTIGKNSLKCCHQESILRQDDKCLLANGDIGECKFLVHCPSAQADLANNVPPPVCGFIGPRPVVCCPPPAVPVRLGANCTGPGVIDGRCVFLESCPTAVDELRSNKTPASCGFLLRRPVVCCPIATFPTPAGVKSKQKCLEYFLRESARLQPEIIGGQEAQVEEFPHMATIGFPDGNMTTWHCGGTLISDRYVMTAAHCLYSQEFGTPTRIRVGDYNLVTTDDDARPQEFNITRVIRHPQYRTSSKYNDIALLELDHPANMFIDSEYIRPACLQTEHEIANRSTLIATGWGLTDFAGNASDVLIKVELEVYPHLVCNRSYSSATLRRGLANGIVDRSQVCAGGRQGEVKDTCQGDSGGPLQMYHASFQHTYLVVGITSFGKACGVANSAGVYTRVSNYVEWIENNIWPQG